MMTWSTGTGARGVGVAVASLLVLGLHGTEGWSQDGDESLAPLVADNFDKGKTVGVYTSRKNSLGAFHGSFSKRPAFTRMQKSSNERRGDSGYALRLDYDTRGGGWAGYYNLFGGVNASPYNTVTFWVKGQKGGETFDIGFIDKEMESLQYDAVYVGSVQLYLEAGVTKTWQKVEVPLCAVNMMSGGLVSLKEFGGIVLHVRNRESGAIYLDDLQFELSPKLEHDYICTGSDADAKGANHGQKRGK